ncbi:MAG: nickel insertion protein [Candidatus Thermoplasmatota archaeon]|nr:nickel insertion protein [Candidatus Thermoplasmatota archaeon]
MDLIMDLRCGISGDMLLGALLEWYSAENDENEFLSALSRAASVQSGTEVWSKKVKRNGLETRRVFVQWEALESSTTSGESMISFLEDGADLLGMNDRVKKLARRILMNILEAEASVHNEKGPMVVHLHEAGTPDTLVDVLGIAYLSDRLQVDGYWVKATPVSLGVGVQRTAHGVYEIPVPAVRHIIRGLPGRSGPVEGELTTPTGIAAARALVDIWLDHDLSGDKGGIQGTLVGSGAGERVYGEEFSNTLFIYEGLSK